VAPCPPAEDVFALSLDVADVDIDELGVANNVAYVRWIVEAHLAHCASVGLELATFRALGGVFVVRRHELDYLRPLRRGACVQLRTWIDDLGDVKWERATEIVERGGAELVARARTTWVWIGIADRRPTRVPASVRAAFDPHAR
jgi:acyl-CoA thioester hydrolase